MSGGGLSSAGPDVLSAAPITGGVAVSRSPTTALPCCPVINCPCRELVVDSPAPRAIAPAVPPGMNSGPLFRIGDAAGETPVDVAAEDGVAPVPAGTEAPVQGASGRAGAAGARRRDPSDLRCSGPRSARGPRRGPICVVRVESPWARAVAILRCFRPPPFGSRCSPHAQISRASDRDITRVRSPHSANIPGGAYREHRNSRAPKIYIECRRTCRWAYAHKFPRSALTSLVRPGPRSGRAGSPGLGGRAVTRTAVRWSDCSFSCESGQSRAANTMPISAQTTTAAAICKPVIEPTCAFRIHGSSGARSRRDRAPGCGGACRKGGPSVPVATAGCRVPDATKMESLRPRISLRPAPTTRRRAVGSGGRCEYRRAGPRSRVRARRAWSTRRASGRW